MTELITISESSEAPVKVGTRWLVTIARPGKGSTGTYSEDVLRESGPTAFPAGTKAFFNHDPKRDVRDMVGTYKDGAFWNEEEGELQAYLTPFKRYAPVLDDAKEAIEASIHSKARKDSKGYVKELVYDRSNTVDLVAFAGLEGSGLKQQVESLFAAAAAEEELNEEMENNMAFELTQELWESLTSTIRTVEAKFDTFVAESKLETQGQADAEAVRVAVAAELEEALAGIADVEKAIDAADIPVTVKESLKERARKGEDIADNLAGAVSIVAEAKKEFAPEPKGRNRGTVVVVDESIATSTPNYRVGRWSN